MTFDEGGGAGGRARRYCRAAPYEGLSGPGGHLPERRPVAVAVARRPVALSRSAWWRAAAAAALVVWLLLAAASPAFAQVPPSSESVLSPSDLLDRDLERRAQALEREIMCPICDVVLEQSFVQMAMDMKKLIREKLAEGESEAEIKAYFVSIYGEAILTAPTTSGFNLLAWVAPPVGVLAGIALVAWVLTRMLGRGATPAGVSAVTEDELGPYLDAVDADLAAAARNGAGRPRPQDAPLRHNPEADQP